MSTRSDPQGFEDRIDLTFPKPSEGTTAAITLRCINTGISEVAFSQVYGMFGDDCLEFVRAVEQDKEMIERMRNWMTDVPMKVYVENGGMWEKVAVVSPEANRVPFSRLVSFTVPPGGDKILRVQLVCMSDVWKVDEVRLTYMIGGYHNETISYLFVHSPDFVGAFLSSNCPELLAAD